jgi:hypothetical protein
VDDVVARGRKQPPGWHWPLPSGLLLPDRSSDAARARVPRSRYRSFVFGAASVLTVASATSRSFRSSAACFPDSVNWDASRGASVGAWFVMSTRGARTAARLEVRKESGRRRRSRTSVCAGAYGRRMYESFFVYCVADECQQKESRAVIEGAGVACPPRTTRFEVSLPTGTWRALRGRDGRIERAYCPLHHDDAGCGEIAEAA